MKRVIILALAFICLSVCSCEKTNSPQNSPQNQLVGGWNVILKTKLYAEVAGETSETTYEDDGWIYTFYENGGGKRVKDSTVSDFRYQYDKGNNTITFTTDGKSQVWSVDVLTEKTFVFNNTATASIGSIATGRSEATLIGKKLE